MKRILLMGVLSFFCWLPVSAQDLIVTTANDSIHCYITGEDSANVYLTMKYKLKSSRIDTYIARENISVMEKGAFPKEKQQRFREDYSRLRLSVDYGYSNRQIDPQDHITRRMRHGYVYGADAAWFVGKNIGFGLRFRGGDYSCDTWATAAVYNEKTEEVSTVDGNFVSNAKMYYLGPILYYRMFLSSHRSCILLGVSAGNFWFRDHGTWGDYHFKMSGERIGGTAEIAYDFSLTRKSALGVAFSYTFGTLKDYKEATGEGALNICPTGKIRLNSVNFTIGYRFGN